MFELHSVADIEKPELYREIAQQLEALLAGESDVVANAANTAALLYHALPDLNWAGFYFLREHGELVLGPFQGKPACVRIAAGKGACGAAVVRRQSVLVEDVLAFPGHIACDSASRSELVVPLIAGETILGVIDLDSPSPSRFDMQDQQGIETLARIYVAACGVSGSRDG
ncbi:MAG TPA: GAF domain-containing protein [Rhizomicrobium sp.]|nr:GAF domain-containing protein [Rhizomicrobium sp.]